VTEDRTMTHEQAQAEFRDLIAQYGLRWTAQTPRDAYDRLRAVNRVLDERGRGEALGQR
jgi:hypothetical protein